MPNPSSGDPPQVALAIPDNNAVGTSFKMNVSVTGCDSVKWLGIYDRDVFLKSATYVGAPTVVTLAPNEVPYGRGIAADLSLVAKIVCTDGRGNSSAPQAARFFPVASVVASPTGDQIVPDLFYADGIGASVVFVGCNQSPTGARSLVKVNASGNVVGANNTLPFPCSNAAIFTNRNAVTGKRWMWEPGVGAFAYDANLTASGVVPLPVKALGVGPDGDAVIFDDTPFGAVLRRVSHRDGASVWAHGTLGKVIADPVINPDLSVTIVYFVDNLGTYSGTVKIEKLDYRDGRQTGLYDIRIISWGIGDVAPIPPVALNASGSIVYIPTQLAGGQSQVLACATNACGCGGILAPPASCPTAQAGALKWQSVALDGSAGLLLPYASDSRLAVITAHHSYFLRTGDGLVSGSAVDPDGALVANSVQPGKGRDFYILNGPAPSSSQPAPMPLEVVAMDSAELGVVFRYEILAGSMTAAVDDGGQVWLRIGKNLVKPLPLPEYRLVR